MYYFTHGLHLCWPTFCWHILCMFGVYLLDQATAAEFIDQQPVTGDHQATDVQPPTRKVAWNKDATLCLLRLYGNMKPKFDSSRYKNCMVWRELAALLQKEEFNYTVEQVEGRWKTLLAAYRRVTDHNNTSGNDRKDFEFMSEMKEILVDNPTIQPQCTILSAEGLRHLLTMKNKTKRKLPDAAQGRNVTEAPSPSTSAGAGSPINTQDTAEGLRHLPTINNKTKRKLPDAAQGRNVEQASSPSTSAGAVSPVNTDDSDSTVRTGARKRKHVGKKQDVMNWLEIYQSQQAAAEENRLQLAREIHSDNMTVMSGLLDILRQVVNKK